MADISLAFNEMYQGEIIYAYTKSEDGFEETYGFKNGDYNCSAVIHYRQELKKVCDQLNSKKNYFELFGNCFFGGYSTDPPAAMYHPSRNYNSMEERSHAMKLLYDYIVQHRSEFKY